MLTGDYLSLITNFKREAKPIFLKKWEVSSVGLEHRLDRAGVAGSNPVLPTLWSISFLSPLGPPFLLKTVNLLRSNGRSTYFCT